MGTKQASAMTDAARWTSHWPWPQFYKKKYDSSFSGRGRKIRRRERRKACSPESGFLQREAGIAGTRGVSPCNLIDQAHHGNEESKGDKKKGEQASQGELDQTLKSEAFALGGEAGVLPGSVLRSRWMRRRKLWPMRSGRQKEDQTKMVTSGSGFQSSAPRGRLRRLVSEAQVLAAENLGLGLRLAVDAA